MPRTRDFRGTRARRTLLPERSRVYFAVPMRRANAIVVTILVLVGIFGATALLEHPAPTGTAGAPTLVIRPGDGASSIGRRLVASGSLAPWQRPAFLVLARATGLQRKLRPGLFHLPRALSAWRLASLLENVVPSSLRVTLPEGRTCADFAGLLDRAQIGDSAALAALCRDSAFAASLGIPAPSLEGWLFPDTYLFEGGETPADVWTLLHRRYRSVMREIGDTTCPVWRLHGELGTLTLASIVEREAAVRSEAPRIAGVFWSRLGQEIPLGADPTVRYALGKFTGTLSKKDLSLDSRYNTRLYAGLPPGPIANPGREALRAAMHPDTAGGWLYFVAKDDGSREHFFARDLNQHVRYKHQAERNRAQSGVMTP